MFMHNPKSIEKTAKNFLQNLISLSAQMHNCVIVSSLKFEHIKKKAIKNGKFVI